MAMFPMTLGDRLTVVPADGQQTIPDVSVFCPYRLKLNTGNLMTTYCTFTASCTKAS